MTSEKGVERNQHLPEDPHNASPKHMPTEQEQEICRRFRAGERGGTLAKEFGIGKTTVHRILRRNGIKKRPGKFTKEQEQKICDRYSAGESGMKLSQEYGISASTITNILRRNGLKGRSIKEAKKGPNETQELDICKRYENGESASEIARSMGWGKTTILRCLEKHEVATRGGKDYFGGLTEAQQDEICKLYQSGKTCPRLGLHFKVDTSTIYKLLDKHDIPRRPLTTAKGGIEPDEENTVCERYQAGENASEIAEDYEVSKTCIFAVLQRNNIDRRPMKISKGGLTDEKEKEVCERYEYGESSFQLSEAYGIEPTTVQGILRRHGIKARQGIGGSDSLEAALAGTGRFSLNKEVQFYVYELARYSNTHCKPGITVCSSMREQASGGEYGENALCIWFETRLEAFFLEQAVLNATSKYAQCPNDLIELHGATEIRALPANELVLTAIHLAEEMEDIGIWEFAQIHIPMTKAQRNFCQRMQDSHNGLPQSTQSTAP